VKQEEPDEGEIPPPPPPPPSNGDEEMRQNNEERFERFDVNVKKEMSFENPPQPTAAV